MEGLIKLVTGLLSILEQYPTWVRMLVSVWVLLTAIVVVIFIAVPRELKHTESPKHPITEPINNDEVGPSAIVREIPILKDLNSLNIVARITEPINNDEVGPSAIVRGMTTLKGLNLYLIVIPLETGDRYIVDGPLTVDAQGMWSGRARFGEGNLGIGEKFAISILATNHNLSEGPLQKLPKDVRISDSIEIIRIK